MEFHLFSCMSVYFFVLFSSAFLIFQIHALWMKFYIFSMCCQKPRMQYFCGIKCNLICCSIFKHILSYECLYLHTCIQMYVDIHISKMNTCSSLCSIFLSADVNVFFKCKNVCVSVKMSLFALVPFYISNFFSNFNSLPYIHMVTNISLTYLFL